MSSKQVVIFCVLMVAAILALVFALLPAVPGLAVGRDALFIGGALFLISALRSV